MAGELLCFFIKWWGKEWKYLLEFHVTSFIQWFILLTLSVSFLRGQNKGFRYSLGSLLMNWKRQCCVPFPLEGPMKWNQIKWNNLSLPHTPFTNLWMVKARLWSWSSPTPNIILMTHATFLAPHQQLLRVIPFIYQLASWASHRVRESSQAITTFFFLFSYKEQAVQLIRYGNWLLVLFNMLLVCYTNSIKFKILF